MSSFIKKLISEEKISFIEPSDEIAASYLQKSSKSLLSSKKLLEIENFDDATALTYYSMYYAALALLFKCGIKSESHTGTIIILKEMFDIDDAEISRAKKERVDKQYYVDFKATKEEVLEGVMIAEDFNSRLQERIDKIRMQQRQIIIDKMRKKYF